VAQPIQEPTEGREIEGLAFRSRQLFRRPATSKTLLPYSTHTVSVQGTDEEFASGSGWQPIIWNASAILECNNITDWVTLNANQTDFEFAASVSEAICSWWITVGLEIDPDGSPSGGQIDVGVAALGGNPTVYATSLFVPSGASANFFLPYSGLVSANSLGDGYQIQIRNAIGVTVEVFNGEVGSALGSYDPAFIT
jgi:hypothetical protein